MKNRSKRPTTSACLIYHGPATHPDAFATEPEELPRWRSVAELSATVVNNQPAVLIADAALLAELDVKGTSPSHMVIIAADVVAERELGSRAVLSVAEFRDAASRRRTLRAGCQMSCARIGARERRRHLVHINGDLREVIHVGMELMCQRDRDVLLHDILALGKELTASDGAALFLAEPRDGEETTLRLVSHEFTSLTNPELPGDARLAVDKTTIIGYAALTKKPLVIDDAYELPPGADYQRNAEFDARNGYRIRSMLIVPMLDQREQLVGVLVLVNRMSDPAGQVHNEADADRYVLPYRGREVRSARALASYAALSIENTQLYARIEGILESFVRAAVTAVDARDPSTAGHSQRVANLTVELAKAVERDGRGAYRDLQFTPAELRELRFAALLHDFGKLSVHEDILLKAKKLPPVLWERVNARFDLIRRTLEAEHYRSCAARDGGDASCLDAQVTHDLEELERLRTMVRDANEPSVTDQPPTLPLRDLARHTFAACDGTTTPYLTEEELHFLELPQGTLDARERVEVEAHVQQTFQFLDQIPWTDDLKRVAEFAHGHHEKLDGTGYPRHLSADAIPVQTRLITLADMFDALTAADRPYKAAVTPERAFEIIESEANAGLLDPELVRLMRESNAYRKILEKDVH